MLSKLIKYDFRALSRVLWPTMAAVAGASLIAALSFRFSERTYADSASGLVTVLSGILALIMVLAIIAACLLVVFLICAHFYRNLMTDEGYLTFTLPVKTSEILWSKLITAMFWTLISTVVVSLCVLMFAGVSALGSKNGMQILSDLADGIRQLFGAFGAKSALLTVEFILLALAGMAYSILHIYLALVIGGVVSHKHKILAGIGFYFVISIIVSVITSIAQYYFGGSLIAGMSTFGSVWRIQSDVEMANSLVRAAQPYYWFNLVFLLAMDTACFLLSKYFLEKKLNLE